MQPRFADSLKVQLVKVTWRKTEWKLITPLRYFSNLFGFPLTGFIVPAGFKTDFASVPRIPLAYWLVKNVMYRPAVIHDYLCRSNVVSRYIADRIFLEAAEADGVHCLLRYLAYGVLRAYSRVKT